MIDEDTIYKLIRDAKETGIEIEITDGILLSKFLAKALLDVSIKQEWDRIITAENDCTKDLAVLIQSYNLRREKLEKEMKALRERCPHHWGTTPVIGVEKFVYCFACKGAVAV